MDCERKSISECHLLCCAQGTCHFNVISIINRNIIRVIDANMSKRILFPNHFIEIFPCDSLNFIFHLLHNFDLNTFEIPVQHLNNFHFTPKAIILAKLFDRIKLLLVNFFDCIFTRLDSRTCHCCILVSQIDLLYYFCTLNLRCSNVDRTLFSTFIIIGKQSSDFL